MKECITECDSGMSACTRRGFMTGATSLAAMAATATSTVAVSGNWGDLGYCLMRFTPEKTAEVRLFQNDYCYPKPVSAEKRPRAWDMIVSDNRNLVCTFDLG